MAEDDDRFDPCEAGDEGVVDIGHDVRYRFFTRDGVDGPAGLIESHPDAEGKRCAGTVTFDVKGAPEGRPLWQVRSLDPLELDPSIMCSCGHHGWIRGGRWIPA